ncbi:MAG: carboxypeptidase M32, partial [Clostridia bacterium]|nr:carboxypeptidase M32 [Clostridia bacterium]
MILSDALKKLKELQIKAHAYEHAMGMLSYDALTAAPSDSAEGRGMSMGILSEEYYKILVNDETGALLDFLWEKREGLS